MSSASPPNSARYITVIEPVTEITLTGSADLLYWQDTLHSKGLYTFNVDGRALLLISAISSNFRGLAFREFTVSVFVSDQEDGRNHDGFYLVHALNSSRLLAFSERVFFKTPYYPADVAVSIDPAVRVQVALGGREVYHSELAAGRTADRHDDEVWEGPLYLPANSAEGNIFYARLGGPTDFYPFADGDMLDIYPIESTPVFQMLLDSDFKGELWRIRKGGSHARTKTYDRLHSSRLS